MTTNGSALIVPSAPVAPSTAPATLRSVHPPVDIPDFWLWLWIAFGLLFTGALVFVLWKYWWNRPGAAASVPAIPPHVRARRRLDDALRLIDEPKPFTIAVSDALRHYLEERFDFHAPERTTEEFLYELQGTELLTLDQKQSLGDFLGQCDLVKFARYEPIVDELRSMHQAAVRLVGETEPSFTEVRAEAGPQPAA